MDESSESMDWIGLRLGRDRWVAGRWRFVGMRSSEDDDDRSMMVVVKFSIEMVDEW